MNKIYSFIIFFYFLINIFNFSSSNENFFNRGLELYNDKKYEELLKDRQDQMADFKKSYNETISKFKNVEKPADKPTEEKPTKENLKVKLTDKLLNLNEF